MKRRRHTPDPVVRKLREADRLVERLLADAEPDKAALKEIAKGNL